MVEGGDDVLQHVAGHGCVFEAGYSGYRIGVEEMEGMNKARYIVKKPENYKQGIVSGDGRALEESSGYQAHDN